MLRLARDVRSRVRLNPRAGAEAPNRTAGSVAGWGELSGGQADSQAGCSRRATCSSRLNYRGCARACLTSAPGDMPPRSVTHSRGGPAPALRSKPCVLRRAACRTRGHLLYQDHSPTQDHPPTQDHVPWRGPCPERKSHLERGPYPESGPYRRGRPIRKEAPAREADPALGRAPRREAADRPPPQTQSPGGRQPAKSPAA